jgi:hypothetical protein
LFVYGTDLVEQDAGGFALEFDFRAAAQGLAFAGQWGDDDAWQYCIHVVGGR